MKNVQEMIGAIQSLAATAQKTWNKIVQQDQVIMNLEKQVKSLSGAVEELRSLVENISVVPFGEDEEIESNSESIG